jgi:hypothetical protein
MTRQAALEKRGIHGVSRGVSASCTQRPHTRDLVHQDGQLWLIAAEAVAPEPGFCLSRDDGPVMAKYSSGHDANPLVLRYLSSAEFADWVDDGPEIITVLKVAVDESGSHQDSPAICVAACFANAAQWRTYESSWRPTAEKYLPKGYHAAEASDADNAVLATILAQTLKGIVITISYDDFREVVTKNIRSVFGAEYNAAVRACAYTLRHWCDRYRVPYMTWVLESGHKGESSVNTFLSAIRRDRSWRIWSHEWVGKEDLVTHASDLVSHEVAACYGRPASPLLESMGPEIVRRHFTRKELV